MRKVTAIESLTLDGVMQAPARPDEDTRGGFEHGGWAIPYADEVMGRAMGERMAKGRGWRARARPPDVRGFRRGLAQAEGQPLHGGAQQGGEVRRLDDPDGAAALAKLDGCSGTTASTAVAKLKEEPGKDIGILGSGELVRSLIGRGLIDEFLLLIHPLVLGSGTRLFPEDVLVRLELVDSLTTTKGVVIATYATHV